jgi:spermidine/putrescine transport system substrate-binding protein
LQGSAAALSGIVLSNCARNLASSTASSDASPSASGSSPAADSKTLYVYSWTSYIDDDLLKDFEAKTGIKAIADTYDSNETMLAKMQAGGGAAYSIIYPSDYMVTQMVESNLLTPLDKSRLKGLDNLKSKWKSPIYDANNAHSIPAAWGTTGLMYDPKKLGDNITGFEYLWANKDALNHKVTLVNDVREVMGATLKSLGYSYNSTKPAEVKAAYDKLVELKPAIASFMTNGWEDQLASGDLAISMAYSADAIALIDENPNLTFVIPEDGTSLWTDTMAIPKTAPNVDAAYAWINFMLQPENSAKVVERRKFSTPNDATFKLLPATIKNNKNLFPSEELLAKCEGIAPLPKDTTDLFDRYWTQLTSS